ncbi:hypothetical protein C2845_PM13G18020 [Panicum miliaceum]|uniref:Uncharacterized protein n=1 Tax=Panicum miliaceum TaxID=4540 RepID=A0A3L6RL39_PANMI|nr:hypothetical protein C2845_PM13G18020 [Panicum miliaceum]
MRAELGNSHTETRDHAVPGRGHDGGGGDYGGGVTFSVVVTCLMAASCGLIFGYDSGISGGATQMDSFLSKFTLEVVEGRKNAKVDAYCKYNNQCHKHRIQFFALTIRNTKNYNMMSSNLVRRKRASPARLIKLYEGMSEAQRKMIREVYFDGLLKIACATIPAELANWLLVKCFHADTSELVIPGRGRILACTVEEGVATTKE